MQRLVQLSRAIVQVRHLFIFRPIMKQPLPEIGCDKSELPTPCLCLCLDRFQANVASMVAKCREHGVDWRPHAKCHKSPVIAQWLVEAGAVGVTCATIREAEVMADAGIRDLLIANLIAGPAKIARLRALAGKADIMICVDHIQQATAVSQALADSGTRVRVLIELEIGMNRTGVALDQAVEFARRVAALPGLKLAGVMAYEGHLLTIKAVTEKSDAIREALENAVSVRNEIDQSGIECSIVSCGGTGSYPITLKQPGITELQAGGAIFMDAFYRHECGIGDLQHALTVLSTVGSLPTTSRAIIDAGRKAMNFEIHKPQVQGHRGIEVDWPSAEHGVLKVSPEAGSLEIGQQIELIPGYADLTNVLHSQFFGIRNGRLEQVIPIVH